MTSGFLCGGLIQTALAADASVPQFVNITTAARVNYEHKIAADPPSDPEKIAAGVAAGDYNQDGYIDLYVVGGNADTPNMLFRNVGNGQLTFDEVAEAAAVQTLGVGGSGATFGDLNNDGWPDLFVGAVAGDPTTVYMNNTDGSFSNHGQQSGLDALTRSNSFSAALADYDLDGDLDLALAHWDWDGAFNERPALASSQTLWANNGQGSFTDVSVATGLSSAIGDDGLDYSFTPNFADINSDGLPDLLLAADFDTSQVFINSGDGQFLETTTEVISDQNGMGASVGDYDNDGDIDWFVTAIAADGVNNPGFDGNRLYRNNGDGQFEDVTDSAGVRVGGWGWGSCFADFNNDGHLDIFHLNGWSDERFETLPSKLFLANGNGQFDEVAMDAGLFTLRQGRGLVCADFDRDGDIDIYIANNRNFAELYRNDLITDSRAEHHWLSVSLDDERGNRQGIGARVYLVTAETTQLRELRAGGNFVSQDPAEAHFGWAANVGADELKVVWPDGEITLIDQPGSNCQYLLKRTAAGQLQIWQRLFDDRLRKPQPDIASPPAASEVLTTRLSSRRSANAGRTKVR